MYGQMFQESESSHRETFEQLLLSDNSATRFMDGYPKLTCQLLFLDLFRAASESYNKLMEDWATTASAMDFSLLDFVLIPSEIQSNANAVSPLCHWTRELKVAAQHLLASLTLRYKLQSPPLQTSPSWLSEMELELEADMDYSFAGFQALRDSMLGAFSQVDANTKQATEKNLARLTLITAVFLPLSYGADILGMQFRIRDLHFILYDYLGLVTASGLFLFVVYKVIPQSRLMFKGFFGGSHGTQKKVSRAKTTFNMMIKQYILTNGIYMVLLGWIVIAASFLVGMIGDISTAIDALKYGLPIFGGILIIWLIGGFLLGGIIMLVQIVTGSNIL
jgi:hypothetical protein